MKNATPQREWRTQRNAKIVAGFLEGLTVDALAGQFCLSPSSITGVLRKHGQKARPYNRMENGPTPLEVKLIETYRSGMSAREAAKVCRVNFQKVLAAVHRWAPESVRVPHLHKNSQPDSCPEKRA